jgi:hypothetical protein
LQRRDATNDSWGFGIAVLELQTIWAWVVSVKILAVMPVARVLEGSAGKVSSNFAFRFPRIFRMNFNEKDLLEKQFVTD